MIGVDLLGHGGNAKPHDPVDYADLTPPVLAAIEGHEQVAGVGFSLGAHTLLRLATQQPHRFEQLVVMGIGKSVLDPEPSTTIVDALEGRAAAEDRQSEMFVRYAETPGNDRAALLACMKAQRSTITAEELAAVTCPVLVVLGDKDFAGPADTLMAALPNARLVTLPGVDHFATPESFKAIDAVLEFLGALPA
ncbi:MAG: putative hydrolase [Acidimicrobiia bacterium]|nr:putative hydrolase [Acidimicrobiia bacterium]